MEKRINWEKDFDRALDLARAQKKWSYWIFSARSELVASRWVQLRTPMKRLLNLSKSI